MVERAMFDVIGSDGMVFIAICLVSFTFPRNAIYKMKNLYGKGRDVRYLCVIFFFLNATEERHANNRYHFCHFIACNPISRSRLFWMRFWWLHFTPLLGNGVYSICRHNDIFDGLNGGYSTRNANCRISFGSYFLQFNNVRCVNLAQTAPQYNAK